MRTSLAARVLAAAVPLAVLGGVAVAAPASAASTTRVVDTDGMATATDCNASDAAETSIQSAIDASAAGDTVKVCPGSYAGPFSVDKPLTLLGAQAGVDPRGGRTNQGAESILTYTAGDNTILTAAGSAGLTVDGFTFTGASGASNGDRPTMLLQGAGGHVVTNNIFPSSSERVLFADQPGLNFTQNRVATTLDGVFGGVDDLMVTDNAFTNVPDGGVNTTRGDGAQAQNTKISGNAFDGVGNAVFLIKTNAAQITGNTVINGRLSSFLLEGGNTGTVIQGNRVTNGQSKAVSLFDDFGAGVNDGVQITSNQFEDTDRGIEAALSDDGSGGTLPGAVGLVVHQNRLANTAQFAIQNDTSNAIDATDNWYGCNAGPGAQGCSAVIDTGSGATTFAPYLQLRLTQADQTLASGQKTQLTADLLRNSNNVDPDGVVLDGENVAFSSTAGTVDPANVSMTAGKASTTLTGNGKNGTSSATVDNQTVTVATTAADTTPTPVVPEAPYTALLVLAGLGGGFLVLRRRQSSAG